MEGEETCCELYFDKFVSFMHRLFEKWQELEVRRFLVPKCRTTSRRFPRANHSLDKLRLRILSPLCSLVVRTLDRTKVWDENRA